MMTRGEAAAVQWGDDGLGVNGEMVRNGQW